jgi:hypothetical protein
LAVRPVKGHPLSLCDTTPPAAACELPLPVFMPFSSFNSSVPLPYLASPFLLNTLPIRLPSHEPHIDSHSTFPLPVSISCWDDVCPTFLLLAHESPAKIYPSSMIFLWNSFQFGLTRTKRHCTNLARACNLRSRSITLVGELCCFRKPQNEP